MRVALVGDIHANLPALEAVLDHAHRLGAEAIWNIGDFVGYGAFADEVVRRMQQERALSICGNYDVKVLRFPRNKEKWKQSKRAEKYVAFQWAYENLSAESREYLGALPQERRLEVEGWRVLLTHGSPASNKEPLTPATSLSRLEELAHMAQADLIVCGHSHQPFARQAGASWFVNTGSVGRPGDGDPRACYALADLAPGSIQGQHFRLVYDLDRAIEAIRRNGLPEAFATMIRGGIDLDSATSGE